MFYKSGWVFRAILCLSCCLLGVALTRGSRSPASEELSGAAFLIETKEASEKIFKGDITSRGLVAVKLTIRNSSTDSVFVIKRSHAVLRTEFDRQVASLPAQRAYDRMMWKIGGGPGFAEYGIGRALFEGSRKKKLRKTVLTQALEETMSLDPGVEITGVLFFERPQELKTFQYSTLVIQEVVEERKGRRFSLRFPLAVFQ